MPHSAPPAENPDEPTKPVDKSITKPPAKRQRLSIGDMMEKCGEQLHECWGVRDWLCDVATVEYI